MHRLDIITFYLLSKPFQTAMSLRKAPTRNVSITVMQKHSESLSIRVHSALTSVAFLHLRKLGQGVL